MSNVNRKERHSYKVSYAYDVGSSFDPDMENINEWEEELASALHMSTFLSAIGSTTLLSLDANTHGRPSVSLIQTTNELTPVDLEDEELEAYAEECAKRAALEDFEDIPEEELFSWSDLDEVEEVERGLHEMEDVEMEF